MLSFHLFHFCKVDGSTNEAASYKELDDSLNVPELCAQTTPPSCLAVPLASLDWDVHAGHKYRLQLLIESVTGLKKTVMSDWYKHSSHTPSGGVVIEVDISDGEAKDVSLLFYL